MMTRVSAVAVVAAAAALAKQTAATYVPPGGSVEDPTGAGGGGEEYEHLGCFHDSKNDRVLGDKLSSSEMTTKMCVDHCSALGAAFMATQYGFECWCSTDGGLDYDRHYDLTGEDAVCDLNCFGDETEICGGYDTFELYKLTPVVASAAASKGSSACSDRAYAQCGGAAYTRSTCCPEGFECLRHFDDFYSQCRPTDTKTAPAPVPPAPQPVASTQPTMQTGSSACSDRAYTQCGGIKYTGETCCPEGFACTSQGDDWYLQCRPDGSKTAPSPVAPKPTPEPVDAPTPEPVDAPTPEPVETPTPEPSAAATPKPSAAATPEPSAGATPEPSDAPTPKPVAETPQPQPVASPEPEPQQPVGGGQYGQSYTGDATYYGFTTAGNCAYRDSVPGMYTGMTPIALNNAQYGDSLMCGACLEGTANGNGSGANPIPSTFKGFITDRCPECAPGDLDFSMSGDGRWDIEWEFVPCPGESISFAFEGSNPYYWKLQPRGTRTPVVSLTINGVAAARTQDNFFVLEGGPWEGAQTVVTTTVGGVTETTEVTR